jgi:benzil reductase ((S)-benzoin forming)
MTQNYDISKKFQLNENYFWNNSQLKPTILMTGASRGIGLSLKKIFEKNFFKVVSLERNSGFNLSKPLSKNQKETIVQMLCFSEGKENSQENLFLAEKPAQNNFWGFIHCAGAIDQSEKNTQNLFQINTFSFIEIFSAIEELALNSKFTPRIMSLSSGAAISSYVGWENYCASKAALLSYSQCLSKKYTHSKMFHLSIAPGTVLTDMMKTVLALPEKSFPNVNKFKELNETGKLITPEIVAEKIFQILQNENICSQIHGIYSDLRKPPLNLF